jgi:hypothetical protein
MNQPAEDIRDIRLPPLHFPLWLVAALSAGGLLTALAAYALWRRRRRRPMRRLPHEIALQRLEQIRPLMQPASAPAFAVAVSDVVRHYVETAFAVTATQRTTEEFLRDLIDSSQAALGRHRASLAEFLHQCDLAKFAGLSPTPQGMESLYEGARAFISESARDVRDPVPAA